MRVAVMGTGGMGGYFGGLLARAGHDVAFIARGAHLQAIRERGLRIESAVSGEFTVRGQATDDPSQVGEVDLVLFTVKTYHNAQAIPALQPMMGPGAAVLTMQNGVESGAELAAVLGAERVLTAPTLCESFVQAPGLVVERMPRTGVALGEFAGGPSLRIAKLSETLREAGWTVETTDAIESEAWFKCMFICAMGSVLAASRSTMGEVMACNETRTLYVSVLQEVEEVARARGIVLDTSLNIPRFMGLEGGGAAADVVMRFSESLPGQAKSSMLRDAEAGRPLEIDALNGAVVRLGREVGAPTPANAAVAGCLRPAHLRALGS